MQFSAVFKDTADLSILLESSCKSNEGLLSGFSQTSPPNCQKMPKTVFGSTKWCNSQSFLEISQIKSGFSQTPLRYFQHRLRTVNCGLWTKDTIGNEYFYENVHYYLSSGMAHCIFKLCHLIFLFEDVYGRCLARTRSTP